MEVENKTKEWIQNRPEIIFSSRVQGMGIDAVTVAVHKNYTEYTNFLTKNRKFGSFLTETKYILIDLGGDVAKPLSFKYLAEKPEK